MTLDPCDRGYGAIMGRAVTPLAGLGYVGQQIPDLDAKLVLARAMLGLSPKAWSDQVLCLLLFGAYFHQANFSRKKQGKQLVSVEDAAALAQLLNFFIQKRPKGHDKRIERDAVEFMQRTQPGHTGLQAVDIARPLLEFAGRLAEASTSATPGTSSVWLDTLHDRTMTYLNGLNACSHPSVPALIERAIEGQPTPGMVWRFGSRQAELRDAPANLEPLPLPMSVEQRVGLPFLEEKQKSALWTVTVRDPRPPTAGQRRGPYAWQVPWANLVRSSGPHMPILPGQDICADYGSLEGDDTSTFRLFLLLDRGCTGAIAAALGESGLVGERMTTAGFQKLLTLAASGGASVFECYTRPYRVYGDS